MSAPVCEEHQQLWRLYRVICRGMTKSRDARAVASAIIDEFVTIVAEHEADMAALRERGDRLAEAALHITQCRDLSGLTGLIAAIEEWEGS